MPDNTQGLWQSCGRENEVAISLPHIRLGGRVWGEDDKPLLLALHGWLDNANSFQPLSNYLKDYQLLAIDWPGHGASQHRPGAYPLHWIDYLYDLECLIEHISRSRTLYGVIGHSLGGIVASAYSAAFAQKVPNWILIEALSPLFESSENSRQRLVRSFQSHSRQKPADANRILMLDSAVKARHKLTGLASNWCELLIERNLTHTQVGLCWRSDPRLKLDSPMRLNFEHIKALMQDHPARVLAVSADKGYRLLSHHQDEISAWYRNLTLVQLAGDHHLHMGNAAGVAAEIKKFLVGD
ncbi:alpha/beta hydrolase [Shewanella sp. AS1]|uniref:alpha/beta fold hydrolase n=1 Tax=Shewanella sp. AS1 TaxID=2907626 RepID=UPI001F2F7C92|nr:alpha/beta hydrolase [Shewanella sp. AS1]MCE9678603.1 alpha/beta hydrolase [Shewanella sp. AS1]